MSIKKITADQIYENSMERVANRPTEASRFGRGGMTPAQLKAYQDKLALVAVEKVNEIIDAINADASAESLAALIKTPILQGDSPDTAMSLYDVLVALTNGDLAGYFGMTGLLEENLQDELARLEIWSGEKRKQAADDVFEMIKGDPDFKGQNGKSAYEIAVIHGFEGTEEEWLASLALAPPVTEADNGKFLRVENGAWVAVALTDVSQEGA